MDVVHPQPGGKTNPEMAEEQLRRIGDEIRALWQMIREVAIVHRVGRLRVGETAVVIALSTAHRQDTFDALHYAIDRLKEIVPLWKKEVWADGAEWRSERQEAGSRRQGGFVTRAPRSYVIVTLTDSPRRAILAR